MKVIKMDDLLKNKTESEKKEIYINTLGFNDLSYRLFFGHVSPVVPKNYNEEKEKIEFDNIKPFVIDKPEKLFKHNIDSWDKIERALKYIFDYDDNQCSSFIHKYYTKESRKNLWN